MELPEQLSAAFVAAIEEDGERLVDELNQLQQMPQVKCNDKHADDPTSCPTHVEAARLLRAKVLAQHGSAGCLAKAHEALAAKAAPAR
ncbi:hypothetical protein AB1Y20_019010 [Prymnesium parvum]|uniref:Uncharacterized protein n=1 Tax=Prymnesium parvum TaxID=97485 RepID=A0AB34JQ76_PRYPA